MNLYLSVSSYLGLVPLLYLISCELYQLLQHNITDVDYVYYCSDFFELVCFWLWSKIWVCTVYFSSAFDISVMNSKL